MARVASDAKLMFHPTDLSEVYRMLGIMGGPKLSANKLSPENKEKVLNFYLDDSYYCYKTLNKMAEQGLFDEIDNAIEFGIYGSTTILDPFAGEGEWLSTFKKALPTSTTIAVEIEKNRYETIKADHKINCAFEESEIPTESIGMLLYNPPYGTRMLDSVNGSPTSVRNVRWFLEEILRRNILTSDAAVIAVVTFDDFMECYDLIYQNFELRCHYAVNEKEFSKYKQNVFYLKRRFRKLNFESSSDSINYINSRNSLVKDPPFKVEMFSTLGYSWFPSSVKFNSKLSKFRRIKKRKGINSNLSLKSWQWLLKEKTAKIGDEFELVVPKPPKVSEIANILASGVINGRIDDHEAPHIVSGGVKRISKVEIFSETNSQGVEVEKRREIKMSRPYLAVLIADKDTGKLKIKEIEGSE